MSKNGRLAEGKRWWRQNKELVWSVAWQIAKDRGYGSIYTAMPQAIRTVKAGQK